jgi:N-acetyl-gamma-glutamylphosphate reductase
MILQSALRATVTMVAADVLKATGLHERVASLMYYNVAKHAHQAEPTQRLAAMGPMPQLHVQVRPSILHVV